MIQAGATPRVAIDAMLAEVKRLGGDGGVIAVTEGGDISMSYNSQGMKRAAVATDLPLVTTTFD